MPISLLASLLIPVVLVTFSVGGYQVEKDRWLEVNACKEEVAKSYLPKYDLFLKEIDTRTAEIEKITDLALKAEAYQDLSEWTSSTNDELAKVYADDLAACDLGADE